MPRLTLKLDKERELVFTFPAVERLDSEYGINLMRPSTYSDLSPRKGAALVWAAQLHTKDPLDYAQVLEYLPTDTDAYYEMMAVATKAVEVALGVKPKNGPAK